MKQNTKGKLILQGLHRPCLNGHHAGTTRTESDAQARRPRRRGQLAARRRAGGLRFLADSTLKGLLALPVVGGIFLVVLLLGANADEVLAVDVREVVAQVFAAMRANIDAPPAFSRPFAA